MCTDKEWSALVSAIIIQAIKDDVSRAWFESDWCEELLTIYQDRIPGISGGVLYDQIQKNKEQGLMYGLYNVTSDYRTQDKRTNFTRKGRYYKYERSKDAK